MGRYDASFDLDEDADVNPANHPPAHRIETERLVLRQWREGDAPRVRESLDTSDAHLRPWVPFMKHEPQSLEGTVGWIQWRRGRFYDGEDFCYGIFSRDETTLLGETMLLGRAGEDALEIGYWIDVRQTGRGYATEAAAAMVWAAFALHGVARVEMVCAPANESSWNVPKKLGFVHESMTERPSAAADAPPTKLMVWALTDARKIAVPSAAYDTTGRPLARPDF